MTALLFCTTNSDKFITAFYAFEKSGLMLEQLKIEVDEIQSEDPLQILEHKSKAIYDKVKKPLIVTDDSWHVPTLNGFPGPYMKSMNHWLQPEDWLNLMSNKTDRRIYLHKRLAYIDESGVKYFEDKLERHFMQTAANTAGSSIMRVVSDPRDSLSLAEMIQQYPEVVAQRDKLWEEFISWYKNKK